MSQLSPVQQAGAAAIAKQSWFLRRKDSLTAVAGVVLQIAQVATVYAVGAPLWVSAVIALIIGTAEVVIHAATPQALTPSGVSRAAREYQAQMPVPAAAVDAARQVGDTIRAGREVVENLRPGFSVYH
ncbi:hypothetical protein B842_03225 [Corynebacterium humireducens NBRC 106098 = DSM 45392]|uniref:Uncharacterized protein n=1 Tax=Corynebacterium humireducens NBRC 106098 = DSM 45392 TaxID=1223515 RepID=A0A0B5D8E4_9CORY|nr:hypothetical protein [Corynebacterium humireducens]AJE32498.1 hypothetical protein B842_03225 [Corynebacterium humireducens NBRC 106098 = DSM 45392]